MAADVILFDEARPPRADAVRNRELLLVTAERLFSERGVETVPMSAIAHEAGVGKGTLYRHFPDKMQLCHALLDHQQRELQEAVLMRLRQTHDPADNLRWFVGQIAQFVLHNLSLFAGVRAEAGLMLAHPAHLWWRQTIRGLLAQCAARDVDVDYAADAIYAMLDAGVLRFQQGAGFTLARVERGLHDLVDRFIRTP
jgi:AcrR family transcriptional regulator